MKSWQDCQKIKALVDLCNKQASELDYIRQLLPQYGDDITQVRFDTKAQRLIICVQPWVWTHEVQEAIENHRVTIESTWDVTILYVKVRFLL